MENFVVSARKYRPTGFDEVVGQEHITTTLKNAIDNSKLAQALLFCGPRGVGKTTCARIVARLINGFEEKNSRENNLNIFELDAASNNSVEDIRNLIDQVRYPPQFGKFKVYIIDEVHMLSNAAFNAFLKTLEEPPSYAIFILATTEKHKVIPTILSRCQIFDFNRIQISDIANHLKKIADREGIPAENEALHLISQKADGALRDALSIFDLMVTYASGKGVTFKDTLRNLHILDYDYYFQVVDALNSKNHSQPLLILDEILRKGFDGHNFIVGLAEHLRNLLVTQDARTAELMEVPESVRKKYAEQSRQTPPPLLLTWLNLATQADIQYKGSKNQRLTVELALMKMAHISHVVSADTFAASANGSEAGLKKKIDVTNEDEEQPQPSIETVSPPVVTEEKKPVVEQTTNISGERPKSTSKTIRLTSLMQPEVKKEATTNTIVTETVNEAYTEDQLRNVWMEFAEQRRKLQAEYQLLAQPYEYNNHVITVTLLSPVHETMLNGFKSDLAAFVRERLKNNLIQITGKLVEHEDKKMLYTAREKFDYLSGKNPALRELKDRLGLDTDY